MCEIKKNYINELRILDNDNITLFDKDKYIIPLYQRAFAWSDKEIDQLIADINDFTAEHYYLGSLIVNLNKDGVYEVIDGQQRLTALFLLLDYVGDYNWGKGRLSYECRERSNFTLDCLAELTNDNIEPYLANAEEIEQTLLSGRNIIADKFRRDKIDKETFVVHLKKVILYRIEVPSHTDLNRYFEIMNVRGEQLEQHDILKAKLMEPLDSDERAAFALVWDACRDMTGYVQMHFDTKYREKLFCDHWDWLALDQLETLFKKDEKQETAEKQEKNEEQIVKRSALDIVKLKSVPTQNDGEDEANKRIRFESIIGFPHFLLHVLKVFASTEKIDKINTSSESDKDDYEIPKLLDDKKLLDTFTSVINSGKQHGKPIDKKDFSLKFIKCLLKCRFLFDKYIIKREYKNEDQNGDWSLKELIENNHKAQYNNTEFKDKGEWTKTYDRHKVFRHSNNLMLQSCLRVSYTSPRVMHWITELLKWLYDDNNRQRISQYQFYTENITQDPIKEFLLKKDFRQGVNMQHIVLNYLDYLLWKDGKNDKYKSLNFDNFTFEFRNSVEHWYPQHPSDQSFTKWDDSDTRGKQVDRFGNLCLIQRNINSKFSNLSPTSKNNTYHQMIEKGSLKLRLMSEKTKDDVKWKDELCAEHEKEMIELLCNACGEELSQIWYNDCAKI